MGWRPIDFWNSTPAEFFAFLEGFLELEESRNRDQWRQTQLLAFYNAIYSGNAQGLQDPEDLIKTRWDSLPETKEIKTPSQLFGISND